MSWLALIRGVLTLANALVSYARERKLISAGEALEASRQLRETLDDIRKAQAASDAAAADFDRRGGVPDDSDPNLRD